MDDLIRRADAIALASGGCHPANLADELAKLPSAQSERKIAYLINPNPYGECSECGQLIDKRDGFNFCPNCGAYMRGEEDG